MNKLNEAKAVPTRFTSNGSILLTKATAAESRGRIASQIATDAMISDGMKWTDFISPNGKTTESTSTPELYTALKGAILKGLGATATKLQATPTKSLSDADKATKDNNNKLVGRGMAAQRDAMRLRQDDDYRASKSKATTKSPQTPKTGDKVIDDTNVVNAKICKKIRDLQTYIEGNAPVKDSNDSRELLRGIMVIFTQQIAH